MKTVAESASVGCRVLLAAMLWFCAGLASADQELKREIEFKVPSQRLADAILQFSEQASVQVVTLGSNVTGLNSPGVSGKHRVEDALRLMLKGTGLTFNSVDGNTVSLVQVAAPASGDANEVRPDSPRFARAETDSSKVMQQVGEPAQEDKTGSSGEDAAAENDGIPEILVRDRKTRSLNADIERTRDDIQPYVVFDRELIESSGAADINELIKTRLTMNYTPTSSNQGTAFIGGGNQSSIALRGLDSTQTLILVDGRRAVLRGINGAQVQSDLNAIPLGAIERIEVLPATASGIYGGSATGGVVNVVLRRDYAGLETELGYESSTRGDGEIRRIGINAAFMSDSGNTTLMVNGSFSDAQPVRIEDRSFVAEYARRVEVNEGGPDDPTDPFNFNDPPLSGLTNIQSWTDAFDPGTGDYLGLAPLTLESGQALGSTITFVPRGYSGAASDDGAAFIGNAGRYDSSLANTPQLLGGGKASLLNAPSVGSVSATLRQRLAAKMEGFLQVSASRNYGYFDRTLINGIFVIPADAPNNPFEQDIRVSTPVFADGTHVTKSATGGALIGLAAELSANWRGEFDYAFGRTDLRQTSPAPFFNPLANGVVASGEVDLLRDTNAFPTELASFIYPANRIFPTHSIQHDATLRAAGPVFTLPAGPVVLSMLVERREQRYSEYGSSTATFSLGVVSSRYSQQHETVDSAYLEARIPIVSQTQQVRGLRAVEMQLAGRADRYSQAGGHILEPGAPSIPLVEKKLRSTDPTVGIKIQPVPDLTLRASYGTGFLPPALADLRPLDPTPLPGFVFNLTDPVRGNEAVGDILLEQGGSPELRPEESKTWSAGAIFAPRVLPGLRFSLDWTRTQKKDNITQVLYGQDAINNENAIPGLVTRAPDDPLDPFPVGPIIGFNGARLNAAAAETESYDMALDYTLAKGARGEWALSAAATRLMHNQLQATPAAIVQETVGVITAPAWNANASLTWRTQALALSWTTRYLDEVWISQSHSVDPLQGSARLPSAMYHDFFAAYVFDEGDGAGSGVFSGLEVQGGVKNLFDTKPRFLASGSYYYDFWGSPKLATYYLRLKKAF